MLRWHQSDVTVPPSHEQDFPRLNLSDVHKYGQKESDERLVKEGFHPKASNLTPDEHIKSWLKMSQRLAKKPTKAQFKRGATKFQGQRKSTSRQLTRVRICANPFSSFVA